MASSTFSRRSRSMGIMGAAALAIATLGGSVMAQAPSPSAPTIPGAAGSPTPSLAPQTGSSTTPDSDRRTTSCRPGSSRERGTSRLGRLGARLAVGVRGRVATVSGIDGTTLTLTTADGWSRTIDTTGVPITRGGATIDVADVRVGDTVGIAQRRADDGTWQVTAMRVALTLVRGTVAAIASDGFTLTTRAGATTVVRVSDATTWGCRLASLTAVEVGDALVAQGVSATDGSLDATAVVTTRESRVRRQSRRDSLRETRRETRRDARESRRELRRESRRELRRERVRRGQTPSQPQAPTASPSA